MYNYAGKRIIVTGAANGIGKAIARRLSGEKCSVALWDVDAARLQSVLSELGDGHGHSAQVVDVSNLQAVKAAYAATTQAWGADPDVLVNNAGVGDVASILDVTPEEFDRTMRVNVVGTFNCSHTAVPSMRQRGSGQIINMASWFGKSGRPNSLAYCASKFAVIGMTQSMAIDLAAHGIRVNAVCPGTIADTEMRRQADARATELGLPSAAERQHLIPLKRLGQPEDIARVVAFLISDEASYMTGQSINVTGGLWMN